MSALRLGNRTSEEWISLVRVLVLLALIPALWFGIIRVAHPADSASLVLFGSYVILLALGPRWLALLRKPDLIIASDILVVTAVVLISGSLNSPFIYLYYLTILEAAARLNLRQAIAASLAMAGIIVLLWARAGQVATLETTGFRLGGIIAGGFFIALFLSALVQEYRATQEQAAWAEQLDQRLKQATAQLEEQLTELRFYGELAGRLSGELRVDGVLTILLQVFLTTTGLTKGVAHLHEDGGPQFAAAMGLDWGQSDRETEFLSFPPVPPGAIGGEVLIRESTTDEGEPGPMVAFVPLIRAGALRGWLCGFGAVPESFPEPVLRRLRGMATQGVSALEAARLHEEVQRMVSVNPTRSLFPWNGLQRLIAEEIRRSTELVLVFSLAEIQIEDYAGTMSADDTDRDLVLRRVVKLLQSSLRRVDVMSHDGAGRFVLMLARVPKTQAVDILKRLIQKLEEDSVAARLLEVPRLRVTAAVVAFPEDGRAASDLYDKLSDLIAQGPGSPGRVQVPGS